jgi:hypothetical protein
MPAVGDLDGARRAVSGGLAITTATIARDDADAGMSGKPSRNRAGVPVWEKIDNPAPFKVADQRPISDAPLPSPVIDPDDAQRSIIAPSMPANGSKQGIATDREHETPYEPRSGAPAEGKTATMDDAVKAARAPRERSCDLIAKGFDKGLATTRSACTPEPSNCHFDRYGTPVGREIGDRPAVSTMNAMRPFPTSGAMASAQGRPCHDDHLAELLDNALHVETFGKQKRADASS